jgi:hypothetical protein
MGLISKKPGRQESGEPVDPDPDQAAQVEVTIEGPDAQRLEGLIDMAAIAASLKARAANPPPSKDA